MFQLRNAVLVKSEAMHAVSAGRKQRLKTVITLLFQYQLGILDYPKTWKLPA
jgi:hypothetical protein